MTGIMRVPHSWTYGILDRWESVHVRTGVLWVPMTWMLKRVLLFVSGTRVRAEYRTTVDVVAHRHTVLGRMLREVVLRSGMLGHTGSSRSGGWVRWTGLLITLIV